MVMRDQPTLVRAHWQGAVVAESDQTIIVEGNHYFPMESVKADLLANTRTRTLCPWKGIARYKDVTANGVTARNAAWYYPRPSPFARKIKGHLAFWNGVVVAPVWVASTKEPPHEPE
jgi:uncharacterized protein (DUF427 family)